MKYQPIITSVLDTDWYKLTMRHVIAKHWPHAVAHYEFINRGQHKFPKDFANHLQDQVEAIGRLRLSDAENEWVRNNRYQYLVSEDLRLDPLGVTVSQEGEDLELLIVGQWEDYTLWEVPLMSTIAELYYKMTGQAVCPGFIERMDHKAVRWIDEKCYWSDFGTRRRYSYSVQDEVNSLYRHYQPFFLGTSNPHFAMKYNLPVLGTYAHEGPMAMQVLAEDEGGFHEDEWLDKFSLEFGLENTYILGDTLGLETTLRCSNRLDPFAGFRIDSGDPLIAAGTILEYYHSKGIDMREKTLLFSDGLDVESVIRIDKTLKAYSPIQRKYGIGTHLTNDVGLKPMNMVIKLTHIAKGDDQPFQGVVKLSDSPGKELGDPEQIARLKAKFGIR